MNLLYIFRYIASMSDSYDSSAWCQKMPNQWKNPKMHDCIYKEKYDQYEY